MRYSIHPIKAYRKGIGLGRKVLMNYPIVLASSECEAAYQQIKDSKELAEAKKSMNPLERTVFFYGWNDAIAERMIGGKETIIAVKE